MRIIKIIFTILTVLFLLLFFVIFFTENATKDYFISKFSSNSINKYSKLNGQSLKSLDSLVFKNPNTIFYFFTYYCSPCRNSIEKGSTFDSTLNSKIIYISIDNISTIEKIDKLVSKNVKIDKIIYISDNELSGTHFARGRFLFDRYYKVKKMDDIGYPFKLYSNSNSIIDSFSLGTRIIK